MNAELQLEHEFDAAEEPQLAAEIARVMHYRPLMSRLARVGAGYADAASAIAQSAARLAPIATPAEVAETPPPLPADRRSLEEVIDDLRDAASAPPCAEWLDNARAEQRQQARRYAMAWLTTFAITGAIIAIAALIVRA